MPRAFNLDDLVGSVVDRRGPAEAFVSLWACGLLVFPVDAKMISIEALLLIGLPLMIAAGRTDQIDLVVLLTLEQQFSIHVACIHHMLLREQIFALETFVNECCSRIEGNRSGGRFDMGDQVRTVFFTAFGQMDLLSHPGGRALFAVMRLEIVGRAHREGGRRNVLGRAPADLALDAGVVLNPDLAQNFDGRNLSRGVQGPLHHRWHGASLCHRPPSLRAAACRASSPRGVRASSMRARVSFDPFRLAVIQQPIGCDDCQTM
jgi:hypothetical protein